MTLGPIVRLVIGVFACSTSAILIKTSQTHPIPLSAYRLLVAAVALTPVFLRACRTYGAFSWRDLRVTLFPGLLLALHFISWIMGVRMTLAANASLIVNMVPVAMPFLVWFAARERITRGELMGTALAVGGAVLLGVADFHTDRQTFLGDGLCFVAMLLFAGYLFCGRVNRNIPSIWLFVVPLYYVAGFLCLVPMLFMSHPFAGWSGRELLVILGLGIIPTVIGHSSLLHAMKSLRPQLVSIVNLGQFAFAGILAFLLMGERPAPLFYPACLLLIAGSILAIRSASSPVVPAGD